MSVPKHPKGFGAGGRPRKFTSPEELDSLIAEYFAYCDNKTKEIHSEKLGDMVVADPEPYTMSGLAYALGVDRKTLVNYSRQEEYFHTINAARSRVEQEMERRMSAKDTFTPGLIFSAKNNFGWVEKVEQEIKQDTTIKGEVSVNADVKLAEDFAEWLKKQ